MLDDDRKNRLMELFAAASELTVDERPTFLQRLDAEDPELRRELIELLRVADHELVDFLLEPIVAAPHPPLATSHPERFPTPPAAPPLPQIPGYDDLRQIGQGGMSTVYRATQHTPVRRTVAIKTLRSGLDSRQLLARFAAERQALARMAHPHIAAVYDAGTDQLGRPWLAMEFVDGQPITDYCTTHGLAIEARLELLARVCDAIDHAHRRGVLHRDLKPCNVLVVHDDHQPIPKLIDFGIAKALEGSLGDESIHTLEGSLLGTPEYMSPEQIAGDGRAVDTRSDVYAAGVMLYELVTGERPFDSERLRSAGLTDLLRIVRDEVPPKPSTRLRRRPATANAVTTHHTQWTMRVKGDLDWVVMKAIDKDPERRYATPRALADDLRRFLGNLPVEAGPPSQAYRLRKFVRRYRGLVVSSLVLLVSLIAGLITVSLLAAHNQQLAERERSARDEADAANRSLRHNLYRSQMRLATEAMHAPGGTARARELTAAWQPAPGEPDLRGFEWHLLRAHCSREALVVEAERYPIALTWSDDDRVFSTHWRQAIAWRGDTGERLASWQAATEPVSAVATDGAGKVIALSTSPTEVTLRDVDSGRVIATVRDTQYIYRATMSRDGSKLLTISDAAKVKLWDARTGAHLADLPGGTNGVMAAADDGRMFATRLANQGEALVAVYRLDALPEPVMLLRAPAREPWQIDFDDAGERLALACNDGSLCVWSLTDGALLHHLPHPDGLHCVAFAADGQRIAVGCQDYVAYVHDFADGTVQRLTGHDGVVNALTWNRDGTRLVTLADDATLRWWDPRGFDPQRTRQLARSRPAMSGQLVFLGDGDELAVRSDHGDELTWNLIDDSLRPGFTMAHGDARFATAARELPPLPPFQFAALAGDGTLAMLSHSPRTLWLWPPHADTPTQHDYPHWTRGGAWLSDGHLLTIDAADMVRLFDGRSGEPLLERPIPQGPLAIAAAPQQPLVAIATAEPSVLLWTPGADDFTTLRGHTGHVQAVAFAPDGTRLASGGRDRTVRIWDLPAGAEVASLRFDDYVIALAFSRDGRRLAALGSEGRIVLWDARHR